MAAGIRLLLWAVVTSLPFSPCLCGEEFPICAIPCCTVQPSCSQALNVTCDCRNRTELRIMELHKHDIPETVKSIQICNVPIVNVAPKTIVSLAALEILEFLNITRLQLQNDSLHMPAGSKLHRLTIDNVQSVDMHPATLSGSLDSGASIVIQNVGMLSIREHALNFSSTGQGPDLLLEGRNELHLAPYAFGVRIWRLKIKNVHMEDCHPNSFSGNISSLVLEHVNISRVHRNCITGSAASRNINIFNSSFENVRSEGISGKTEKVEIKDSSFSRVYEKGLVLNATYLGISDSIFGTLMPNAFSVKADEVAFDYLKIELLQTDALKNIEIADSADSSTGQFIVRGLSIKHAEYGSLALSQQGEVDINNLRVSASPNLTCTPEELNYCLVGKRTDDDLTTKDKQILKQLGTSLGQQPGESSLSPPLEKPHLQTQSTPPNRGDLTYGYHANPKLEATTETFVQEDISKDNSPSVTSPGTNGCGKRRFGAADCVFAVTMCLLALLLSARKI